MATSEEREKLAQWCDAFGARQADWNAPAIQRTLQCIAALLRETPPLRAYATTARCAGCYATLAVEVLNSSLNAPAIARVRPCDNCRVLAVGPNLASTARAVADELRDHAAALDRALRIVDGKSATADYCPCAGFAKDGSCEHAEAAERAESRPTSPQPSRTDSGPASAENGATALAGVPVEAVRRLVLATHAFPRHASDQGCDCRTCVLNNMADAVQRAIRASQQVSQAGRVPDTQGSDAAEVASVREPVQPAASAQHDDRHECGGLWIGGFCVRCWAACRCEQCRERAALPAALETKP